MSQTTNLGKVCVTPKGTHDSTLEYKILDIVTDNGSSYIAIQDVPANTDISDTDYWQLIASKGGTGEITEVTASISGGYGTPGVTVTEGGTTTEKTLAFAFTNLVGSGIASITGEKTGTSGAVDTYTLTITYDSGETDTVTYEVTNGSVTSVDGMTGAVDLTDKYATIADIEQGEIVANKATSAKAIDPASADSGVTQDIPFIAQGTGTGNGTTSVDTSDTAQNLRKNGNTVVVNEHINVPTIASDTYVGLPITNNGDGTLTLNGTASGNVYAQIDSGFTHCLAGHYYLVLNNNTNEDCKVGFYGGSNGNFWTLNGFVIAHYNTAVSVNFQFNIGANTTFTNLTIKPRIIDLTQWFNGNVPQDLLDHPENWGRYYAGSLAYNAGTLTDCTGRYLKCGQGKESGKPANMWDEQTQIGRIDSTTGAFISGGNYLASKNPIRVSPNQDIYIYLGTASYVGTRLYCYDINNNYLGYTDAVLYGGTNAVTTLPNTYYVMFYVTGTTYNHDIGVYLYYSTGDGYNQYYPYVEPKVYDTGTETLKAFDYKTNDGVVHTNTGSNADLSALAWTSYGNDVYYAILSDAIYGIGVGVKPKLISNKYETITTQYASGWSVETKDKVISLAYDTNRLFVRDTSGTPTGSLEYELDDSTKTTTQGTPFAENIDINDYSDMAWYDTNDDLVETPQGCTIFYVAAYVPFLDSVYMREDIAGDPEQIVSQTQLGASETVRDGVDTALKNAIGGTLKNQLAIAKTIDFNDTNYKDLSALTWGYNSTYSLFSATLSDAKRPADYNTIANALCTKYKFVSTNTATNTDKTIAITPNGDIWVKDSTYATTDDFSASVKNVLIAYEKATE